MVYLFVGDRLVDDPITVVHGGSGKKELLVVMCVCMWVVVAVRGIIHGVVCSNEVEYDQDVKPSCDHCSVGSCSLSGLCCWFGALRCIVLLT